MVRETAVNRTHEIDPEEAVQYVEDLDAYSGEESELLEDTERALLVDNYDIDSTVEVRLLEEDERKPLETLEIEDPDQMYEELLE